MKANLGKAVTEVLNGFFPDVDYQIAAHGDCQQQIARHQLSVLDRIARRNGFRDIGHLRNEVVRRTSAYWAFKNLPF